MEKDDEVNGEGNSYDFGSRMYNPRLGRWFVIDEYADVFPGISPYAYALNNPIRNIDVEGMWPGDANLMILIGDYEGDPIQQQGDWTIVRAESLVAAVKIMHTNKLQAGSFDNLFFSTHGAFDAPKKASSFITSTSSGGNEINNGHLGSIRFKFNRTQSQVNADAKNMLAFNILLMYLGKDPEIVLGACCVARSEEFTELLYDYIDSKLAGNFKLYVSNSGVLHGGPKDGDVEPKFDEKLIKNENVKLGLGFKEISKSGQSGSTFNLEVNSSNFSIKIFDFSEISSSSNPNPKPSPKPKSQEKPKNKTPKPQKPSKKGGNPRMR